MDWRILFPLFRLSLSGFTDGVTNALSAGWGLAASRGHTVVAPEHLLVGMARTKYGLATLARLGLALDNGVSVLVAPATTGRCLGLGPEVRSLLNGARAQARSLGSPYVGSEHLILSLLSGPTCPASDFLRRCGASEGAVRAKLGGDGA